MTSRKGKTTKSISKKTGVYSEAGTVVHPSTKQMPVPNQAKPIGNIRPVESVRFDKKGNITHKNGLKIENF